MRCGAAALMIFGSGRESSRDPTAFGKDHINLPTFADATPRLPLHPSTRSAQPCPLPHDGRNHSAHHPPPTAHKSAWSSALRHRLNRARGDRPRRSAVFCARGRMDIISASGRSYTCHAYRRFFTLATSRLRQSRQKPTFSYPNCRISARHSQTRAPQHSEHKVVDTTTLCSRPRLPRDIVL